MSISKSLGSIGTRDYPIREQYTNIYKVIENTGMVHSSEEVYQ